MPFDANPSSRSLNEGESFLDWLPRFSLGDPVLDEQHLQLVALFQRAHQCLADDGQTNFEKLAQALEAMQGFAREHFRSEEAILKECGNPALEAHRGEHAGFIHLLSDFIREAREEVVAPEKLLRYLGDWWARHLQYSDSLITQGNTAGMPSRDDNRPA